MSASSSSSGRTAVTLGLGMVLSTCVSTISKHTFRTWVASLMPPAPSACARPPVP